MLYDMRNHFLWCECETKASFIWISSLFNTVPLLAQLDQAGQQRELVPRSFASLSSRDQNTFILPDPRHFTWSPSGFSACKVDMTGNVNTIYLYLRGMSTGTDYSKLPGHVSAKLKP